jgi:hypothetical protein
MYDTTHKNRINPNFYVVLYNTSLIIHTTQFSLISAGLCKYPIKEQILPLGHAARASVPTYKGITYSSWRAGNVRMAAGTSVSRLP